MHCGQSPQRNQSRERLWPEEPCISKKNPDVSGQGFTLVDPDRENWNCIFEEIERLSDKLAELGVDGIMEASDV